MMKNSIILSLIQIQIQKTSHFFKSYQRDKDHIFVQFSQNFIRRKLLQKVVSDQCSFHLSE